MTYRDIDVAGLDKTKLGVAYYNPRADCGSPCRRRWILSPARSRGISRT